MTRSMTGFGQAACKVDGNRIQADIRTVNHRYCEMAVRMPREWLSLEEEVKKTIQRSVQRGRVDVFISIEREAASEPQIEVNWRLVEGYLQAAGQIRAKTGISDSLAIADLLRIPEIVRFKEHGDEDRIGAALLQAVDDAAGQLLRMRTAEGLHLQADLTARLQVVEAICAGMLMQAPEVMEQSKMKARQRLLELLDDPALFDEGRFAMEAAVMADRSNIDEELTRLQSHFAQFRGLLATAEPAGRKMDFLIQEMNREINTIGAKANSYALSASVVEMKAELEKIREQVQNIE